MSNLSNLICLLVLTTPLKLNAEKSNQVCSNELGIGMTTRLLLSEQPVEDDFVSTSVESRFYTSVRAFYEKSVKIKLLKI